MPDRQLLYALVRLAGIFAGLAALSVWRPFLWASLFQPFYRATTAALLPAGANVHVTHQFDGHEPVIGLFISFPHAVATPAIPLGPGMEAVLLTSAGHAAEPVIILFGIVLAFTATSPAQVTRGFCLAVPACMAIQGLTVPFLLAGSFYTKVCLEGCSRPLALIAWRVWLSLLENGGDWALTAAAAGLCVVATRRWAQKDTPGFRRGPMAGAR